MAPARRELRCGGSGGEAPREGKARRSAIAIHPLNVRPADFTLICGHPNFRAVLLPPELFFFAVSHSFTYCLY